MSLLLFATLATAQAASPAGCDASSTQAATFAEATSGSLDGACVTMEGIAIGRVLVEDDRARYRLERIANDPTSSGAALGFYASADFAEPTRVRVTGRIGDCASAQAALQARDSNVIVMMTGYCHDALGRFLTATAVEPLGPARLRRLLPASAGEDLGNLAPLGEGEVRSRMTAEANRFLDAIRSGNRPLLVAMHGGGPDGRLAARSVDASLALILDTENSPFAPFRAGAGAGAGAGTISMEIFGWKPPLWADAGWHDQQTRATGADAIACFSARPGAAGLWPIDSKDADNMAGRPYACTRIHLNGRGEDARASFGTFQSQSGADEP